MRFSYRMVPKVYHVFWAGMAAGSSSTMPRSQRQLTQTRHPLAGCGGRCPTSYWWTERRRSTGT
jgi:hypothetical protein